MEATGLGLIKNEDTMYALSFSFYGKITNFSFHYKCFFIEKTLYKVITM